MEKFPDCNGFFINNESPYSIYADGRWGGQRGLPLWKERAWRFAAPLLEKYSVSGSPGREGQDCPVKGDAVCPEAIARDLFFLHLTVRSMSPEINMVLSLLEKSCETEYVPCGGSVWHDLPFEKGDRFFPLHAWLFSAAVFGLDETEMWLDAASDEGKRLKDELAGSGCAALTASPEMRMPAAGEGSTENRTVCAAALSGWRAAAEVCNFLRGTVIVPRHGSIPGVAEAVSALEGLQDESGIWRGIDPHQAFNLLAHSPIPSAVRQLEKAGPALLAMRNRDGTWGRDECEKPLATFLMTHALKAPKS